MTKLIGKNKVYPVLRLFPIWRYGARHSVLDGHRIEDGWYPDRYATVVIDSDPEDLRV